MEEKRRHIVAIINPVSGTGNKDKIPRLIDTVVNHDTNDVSIIATEYPGHAREIAAQAVSDGADVVVAIGGDGTVNEVGSALCNTNTALAIIPVGSGNGLARHLRIPMNASRALQVLNNGAVGQFDYCTINGQPFFCTCGMGFDAEVSYKFSNEGTRGFITYIKSTLKEYFKYKPKEYLIDIDGAKIKIDITVMHPFNFISSPILGARLFLKQLDRDHHVSIYRGKRIVIDRQSDEIMHIDGDPMKMPAHIVIEIVSKGINILVPPSLLDDTETNN